MKKLMLVITILMLGGLTSCSSTAPKKYVYETMDGEDKPDWVSLRNPVYERGNKFYSVGIAEASGTANLSMLHSIASNDARNKIAKMIENKMVGVFQNTNEGVEDEGSMVRQYLSERTSVLMRGSQEEQTYYEKYHTASGVDGDTGYNRTQLYVLVSVPKDRIAKMIKESEAKLKANGGLSKDGQSQADKIFDELTKEDLPQTGASEKN